MLVDLRTSVDMLPRMQEMFNVSCEVILFAAVMNIVLIYFQLWRPYKAEEEERGEDIEAGDGLDEEGSSYACVSILGTCSSLLLAIIAGVLWSLKFGALRDWG